MLGRLFDGLERGLLFVLAFPNPSMKGSLNCGQVGLKEGLGPELPINLGDLNPRRMLATALRLSSIMLAIGPKKFGLFPGLGL